MILGTSVAILLFRAMGAAEYGSFPATQENAVNVYFITLTDKRK